MKRLLKIALCSITTAMVLTAAPKESLVPGGIAIIPVHDYQAGTKVALEGRKTSLFVENGVTYALAGIPLGTKAGPLEVRIHYPYGKTAVLNTMVSEKQFKEQHLTIKNKRKVNPNKQDMERITKERAIKQRAKQYWSDTMAHVDFIWPTEGEISSVFGLRRFFNEQERNPHSGLDIAAPEGEAVLAVADATVIETGDFFFSGNLVYLDHGQGLISLYAHLSEIAVKPGDKVKQGQLIGAVGQTGRVTGAHLHFAVMSNEVLVDPLNFLPSKEITQE